MKCGIPTPQSTHQTDEISLSEEHRLICQFASTCNRDTIKGAGEKSELKPSRKKVLIINSNHLWYE